MMKNMRRNKVRLFNNIKKKEYPKIDDFDKELVIKDILERRNQECPGWKFFQVLGAVVVSKAPRIGESPDISFDETSCDFFAIYTNIVNKEIRLNSNPFSEYKRTVESIYQIVREVYITNLRGEIQDNNHIYKSIIASSSNELFSKLRKELGQL